MTDDYLWDRSGGAEPDTKALEELLAPLAHDEPLDELHGRRATATATAREHASTKAKMTIFDKRIVGAATLIAAALGLVGLTLYRRSDVMPKPGLASDRDFPVSLISDYRSGEPIPQFAAVAPNHGADLAITAGETVRIHVPLGAVEVEIQSPCNAEVDLSVFSTNFGHPDEPPNNHFGHRVDAPAIMPSNDAADGRASTYKLGPGAFEYTSQCIGRAPFHGMIVVDRNAAREPMSRITNARVFDDDDLMVNAELGIHVFGVVQPGAIVSIGAKQLELRPASADTDDPIIDPTFATDVPVTVDRAVAAVRVADAKGIHFYVIHPATILIHPCAAELEHGAASLDARGDHAGALTALETAMTSCKADRDMVSRALAYACKAGDATAARRYWRRLPDELRQSLEAECTRNRITRDMLDAP